MRCAIFCVCLLFWINLTDGSHFRGAIITWKPGQNENEIIIDYRISWRRSHGSHKCDDSTIQSGTLNDEGSIVCFNGCSGTIGPLNYQCTDYNVDEDWTSGKGSMTYTHPSDLSKSFHFGFAGSAWISTLVVGGNDWKLSVLADISMRADIGRINTSPNAEITPIIRLQHGCNHTLVIPVYDFDNDIIRCRWSRGTDECGGVCDGLPGSSLDQDQCKLSYYAVAGTGWYAVAIQVEDFIDADSTTPLSSIPVQFLIHVYSDEYTCHKSAVYIPPTPLDNECIGVPFGTTWKGAIVIRVAHENIVISDVKTISPLGMTKGKLYKISKVDWRMDISWSPDHAGDNVNNVFCFTAIESSGRGSERRCIKLLAGVTAPTFVNQTQTPTDIVDPQERVWSISISNTEVAQTTNNTYIRLFNFNGTLVEQIDASDPAKVTVDNVNKSFTFVTTVNMIEKQFYYFLFDYGVMKGIRYCEFESESITDEYFWRFRIRDVTPPKISFLKNLLVTNATTEIEWSVNEPVVNTTCTLRTSSQSPKTSLCNDRWIADNLTEGVYTLEIYTTDMEQNSATFSHSWTVGQKFSVSLRMDIPLSPNDNLEVALVYNHYLQKALDMLKQFYMYELKHGYVGVIISKLSRGSLIIDHEVITMKNTSSVQSMASALAKLVDSDEPFLVFDGKPVAVMEVDIDNARVTSSDLCTLYTSIHSCEGMKCVVEENKPTCHPEEKEATNRAILILSVGLGISTLLLVFFIIVRRWFRRSLYLPEYK